MHRFHQIVALQMTESVNNLSRTSPEGLES